MRTVIGVIGYPNTKKKNQFRFLTHTIHKSYPLWITDLHMRDKALRLSEENLNTFELGRLLKYDIKCMIHKNYLRN